MRVYLRMLGRIRPYLARVALSVIFTILFSLLSNAIVLSVQPFLHALFAPEAPATAVVVVPAGDRGATAAAADELPVTTAQSWLTRELQDLHASVNGYLLQGTRMDALWRIVLLVFFLFLGKNVAQYFGTILMVYVGQRVIKDLRDDLYAQFTRLPLALLPAVTAPANSSAVPPTTSRSPTSCVNVSFTNLVRDPDPDRRPSWESASASPGN